MKVESETNAGFTVMMTEVNEDMGKDAADGEAGAVFNPGTNNSTVR